MNSLLRTVNSMSNRRHMLIRESLQQQLMATVIEMQSAPGVLEGTAVQVCDETLAMCSALEAIFLHGLKDSLLNRVTEALSGPDYDAMPQPSFWGPLLVFSHRGIIDQIQSLSQLSTEVGYCRAWIRLALNEGLLTSYLAAIRRDNSALKPYYERAAFIRDTDLIEVAQRLLESIEYIRFDLVSNSSLLNFWSSTPLLMAAIWSPPMKTCPVVSAVDIAKTISSDRPTEDNYDEIETASSIGSLSSFNSSQNNLTGFNEDEALRIILSNNTRHAEESLLLPSGDRPPFTLASPLAHRSFRENGKIKGDGITKPQSTPKESKVTIPKKPEDKEQVPDKEVSVDVEQQQQQEKNQDEESNAKTDAATVGNSLINKLGWSSSHEDTEANLMTSSAISRTSITSETSSGQTPGEGPTYDALLKSYHTGSSYKSPPKLEELLEKYPAYQPAITAAHPEPRENRSFDEQLGRLAREKGLDLQNYNCLECDKQIGIIFAKANVCRFSGDYFCCGCMSPDEHIIPSRVIHNWDLKKYPVCIKAAKYLSECSTLLDLKVLNPRIYSAVDAMAQLQTLRVQLNMLRAYLFTCREPIIEALQQKVAPRDYLYEHVHQYSVSDLVDIPNGTLAQQLQKVVEFAKGHVLNCWLCSQKGFICEVCSNPKVIYPFDTQSTYRCGACHAVYHSECLNSSKPCPRCERRRQRMDLPLLDMGNSDLSRGPTPTANKSTVLTN
ncbi:hypothetical protein QAD02_018747 [Eretmocerus hayati]|uniref:Uncharacterized protein n=1 Tax=Eretmocerus hayati TaxID=131215 RepID=A0ACC2PHP7_9HYME|nr:hypothetical protein QAD02_018747 [Eretmocerus hayati]